MTETAMQAAPWSGIGGAMSLAKVEAVDGASVALRGAGFGRAAARVALPGYTPRAGDTVLVAQTDEGARFVVGVLSLGGVLKDPSRATSSRSLPKARFARESVPIERHAFNAPRVVESTATELRAASGARATLATAADGDEVLELRGADGALIVAHHAATGRTVLHAPGDLSLAAAGDLSLEAGGAVRVRAGGPLDLMGRGEVRLGASDLDGAVGSALTMREARTQLTTEHLGATIERADLAVTEANLVVKALRTVAGRVKRDVEVLETNAGRIVERAKEAWRETEGLSQTRAGRLRLVAETSLTALGQKATVRAREDVKIEGEKIYLA